MENQKYYDQYWESGRHVSDEWDEEKFQKVLGVLDKKTNVLDYGCGMGHAYQRLLARNRNYAGADVSSVAINDLKEKGHKNYMIRPDSSTESESNQFEGCVCIEVFEHLMDPLAAAKELYRVTSPGGILVATVPNFGYHAWRLLALLRAEVPHEPEAKNLNRFNGPHIRFFCARTFTRLLTDAGFVDVEISSFDDSSIWSILCWAGPFGRVRDWANRNLPSAFHLRFLQNIYPSLFAYRLKAVAFKR
jgi:SAM-dependent methyltransferase